MKNIIFLLSVTVIATMITLPDAACARNARTHTAAGTYIHKSCKTKSCFKKHPNGSYGFYAGKKK